MKLNQKYQIGFFCLLLPLCVSAKANPNSKLLNDNFLYDLSIYTILISVVGMAIVHYPPLQVWLRMQFHFLIKILKPNHQMYLEERIESLERQNKAIDKQLQQQAVKHQQQINEISEKLDQQLHQMNLFSQQLQTKRGTAQAEEQEEWIKIIKQLREDKSELEQSNQLLAAQLKLLSETEKHLISEKAALIKEKEALQAELKTHQTAVEQQVAEVTALLQNKGSHSSESQTNVDELKSQLKQSEAKVAELTKKLDNYEKIDAISLEQNGNPVVMEKRINELKALNQSLNADNAKLTNANLHLADELKQWKEKKKGQNDYTDYLNKQIAEKDREIERFKLAMQGRNSNSNSHQPPIVVPLQNSNPFKMSTSGGRVWYAEVPAGETFTTDTIKTAFQPNMTFYRIIEDPSDRQKGSLMLVEHEETLLAVFNDSSSCLTACKEYGSGRMQDVTKIVAGSVRNNPQGWMIVTRIEIYYR